MMMRNGFLAVWLAAFIVIAGVGPAPARAQSLTPEDIASFKSLPADQRKALMAQYAPDMSSEDAALVGEGDAASGVPAGNGPRADVGPSAPAGHSTLVVASTLQPGDAVYIEMARRNGAVPPDAVSQDFLTAVNGQNPFDIKPDGALHLPGVPAIRIAGLSVASAEKILAAVVCRSAWRLSGMSSSSTAAAARA